MPQPVSSRPIASASLLHVGDNHVVLTLYGTRRHVADLAWQVRRINNSLPNSSVSSKSGSEELFSAIVRAVAADKAMVEILGQYLD